MLCSFSQTGPPTAADKELWAPSTFTEQQASDKLQEKNHKHMKPLHQSDTNPSQTKALTSYL